MKTKDYPQTGQKRSGNKNMALSTRLTLTYYRVSLLVGATYTRIKSAIRRNSSDRRKRENLANHFLKYEMQTIDDLNDRRFSTGSANRSVSLEPNKLIDFGRTSDYYYAITKAESEDDGEIDYSVHYSVRKNFHERLFEIDIFALIENDTLSITIYDQDIVPEFALRLMIERLLLEAAHYRLGRVVGSWSFKVSDNEPPKAIFEAYGFTTEYRDGYFLFLITLPWGRTPVKSLPSTSYGIRKSSEYIAAFVEPLAPDDADPKKLQYLSFISLDFTCYHIVQVRLSHSVILLLKRNTTICCELFFHIDDDIIEVTDILLHVADHAEGLVYLFDAMLLFAIIKEVSYIKGNIFIEGKPVEKFHSVFTELGYETKQRQKILSIELVI